MANQPRKPDIRPRLRLKMALEECRDAGLLVRSASIRADGEVHVEIGSRSDLTPDDDPSFKHAPGSVGRD